MRSAATSSPRQRNRTAPVALTAAAAVAGAWLVVDGLRAPTPPPQPAASQSFAAQDTRPDSAPRDDVPRRASQPAVTPLPALPPAKPTRIRIKAIGVDAPVTGLGLEAGHRLAAPQEHDRNLAGWYQDGAAPGTLGTALIDGHVDTWQGPAVFYYLGALHKGDEVDVDRADGHTAVFTVDAVEAYPSSNFPDAKVYGWAKRAELRIITCGAGYDKRRREYMGNVVVYAHLVSGPAPAPSGH